MNDKTKNAKKINQLTGAAMAFTLAELTANNPGLSVVVTPDNYLASELQAEHHFFRESVNELYFPDWETLPYDLLSPHQSVISDRLSCLSMLKQDKPQVLFVSIQTIMHYMCPVSFIGHYHHSYKVGQKIDLNALKTKLNQAGYRFVNKVIEHGECAFRGSIIDIFPMGMKTPFRIDLFDDEIDTMRTFDVDTQRSIEKIDAVELLPAKEFPFDEMGITQFRQQWRDTFDGNPRHCPIYTDVSDGIMPAGIEYYQPLFFEEMASFFDYLPETTQIFLINDVAKASEQFLQDVKFRYEQRSSDITRPILPVEQLFLTVDSLFSKIKQYQPAYLSSDTKTKYNAQTKDAPKLNIDRKLKNPLHKVEQYLSEQNNKKILIVAESAGRREVLNQLLGERGIHPVMIHHWSEFMAQEPPIAMIEGPLSQGVELLDHNIVIIVEAQLFGDTTIRQRKRQKSFDPDVIIRDLTELRLHAPVVHIEHGVGRYRGLQVIETEGQDNEFLILEYAEGAKIYIPVTSLHLISRYTGGAMEHAPLHHLGSDKWQKEKKKATEQISDIAAELLEIHAKREAQVGIQFKAPDDDFQRFATLFPFEETNDQLNAINDVIHDMCQQKPMDRLVCGDVGFGKTEVAMRAAFLAVQNHKQVCVLVPTTLLAGQHYDNFLDRFAEFPVNIALLSRFKTKKESEMILADAANGKVDILIGTHKLFQKNVKFKELGLLIVDEEHRFGVKQKEHIKALKHNVEILTLTATPIPRTLNMSMAGMRDISLIATPPAKRLAIKTFAQEKNRAVIREAVTREILRGGQVFYLHNKVDTIDHAATELSELLPEAKIEIAHGQMRERQLEKIMSDFYHHQFNVLLCTTIIETGIDIPTANTIIIDRADKFGLAQLHQLRGRVGRSHHQAYCYLLTPHRKAMTADATKRLDALMSLDDLGAGFTLATHDLEIRGAGELLGDEQSGNMHALGFSLYMELLDKSVKAIKDGKLPALEETDSNGCEINLHMTSIIPDDYLGDVHMRLIFYKRISNAENIEALEQLQVEMIDRFGLFPNPLKQLFAITELKLMANHLGIKKINAKGNSGKLTFCDKPNIAPETIIHLIQVHAKRYKLKGPNTLLFSINENNNRIEEVKKVLLEIQDKDLKKTAVA